MEEELILEKTELLGGLLNMVINKGFCTKILGDLDFEGMVILVCYDDQIVAEINYEKGIDYMEIENCFLNRRLSKTHISSR